MQTTERKNWIAEFSKNKRKNPPSLKSEEMEHVLRDFETFLGLPAAQARILAGYCMLRGRRGGVNTSELFEFMDDAPSFESMIDQLESLIVSGWFCYETDGPFGSSEQITLTNDGEVALKTSRPACFPHTKATAADALLLKITAKASSLRNRHIDAVMWQDACDTWIKKEAAAFLRALDSKKLDAFSRSFTMYMACEYLAEEQPVELQKILKVFFKDQFSRSRFRERLLDPDHPIYKLQLAEKLTSPRGELYLKPTSGWLGQILSDKFEGQAWPEMPPALIRVQHDTIRFKELIYNKSTTQRAVQLTKLLKPNNYERYVKRARKQIGNGGLIILLSGPPGTGKTELARQLARSSTRDLLLFDVSRQRQMYFGESEKAIRDVFTTYRRLVEALAQPPILLFNECDSIFQRRMSSSNNTAQTENAVQTILLNEMEDFSGIMICTTNRPEATDAAFARRFHFHMHIQEPDQIVRFSLLSEFFPDYDCRKLIDLSNRYRFTAAQLEVYRKQQLIGDIVTRKKADGEATLEQYLQSLAVPLSRLHVTIDSNRKPIGFRLGGR